MTALQELLEHDPQTGEHKKAFMLRRLAQLAIIEDRDISQTELAARVGFSRNSMSLYFKGEMLAGRPMGPCHEAPSPRPARQRAKEANRARAEARREAREDEVERAIEAISAERGIVLPPASDYIPEVLTRELMKAPA